MRNFKINKGDSINFIYSDKNRVGTLDKIVRSAGKSSIKENRGKQLILFTVVGDDGKPKSYHYNKMTNIQVGAGV